MHTACNYCLYLYIKAAEAADKVETCLTNGDQSMGEINANIKFKTYIKSISLYFECFGRNLGLKALQMYIYQNTSM